MLDEHPERLKSPLQRIQGKGFVPMGWDAALDRVVGEIRRIQETYGKDSLAILTGASLTNEKAYLMGKFARVALQTAKHRLQRSAVHGVGRHGFEEGLWHRSQWQSVERYCRSQRDSWLRAQTLRSALRSRRITFGGHATAVRN